MRMKNRIVKAYPQAQLGELDSEKIYVVDFTERTKSKRGIEIHSSVPLTPDSQRDMDCLEVKNAQKQVVVFNIFGDHQFKTEEGKDIQHCECCLFPETQNEKCWVAFVEIKDCKIKNVSNYKDKVKTQIISTVLLFREKQILDRSKNVYGTISFPRKGKMDFNAVIFGDPTEYKRLYQKYRIHFLPTNAIVAEDEKMLKVGK